MKKYFKRISVTAIACAVVVSSLPGMTVMATESQNETVNLNSDWSKDIDSMLEAQDYAEGQVIAVFDNSISEDDALSTLSDDEDSEDLGTLSDEAVEETVDTDLDKSDEAAVIRIISSDEKSTEELLNELASNQSVIYAQPDYISSIEDEIENDENLTVETENDENSITSTTTLESDAENTVTPLSDSQVKKLSANGTTVDLIEDQGYKAVGDLSGNQWAYNNEPDSLYSMHSPNWNATGETNVDDDTVVVGVMDTGIDYTHPDLKDLIVDLSQYSKVAGQYGYNSAGDGNPLEPMDDNGHGTHCAGIIAAKWDGTGTSGVASGVKIAAVKAGTADGHIYDDAEVRGFMCFKEAVENGLNLKSINCSFGGDDLTDIELMLVNELGKLGVVTCFAAGNSINDNDDMDATSSAVQESPYGIIVDAENAFGDMTNFTCYGQSTTDLFAPGCSILSPTSKYKSKYMASVDKNSLSYDGFTGEESESGVKIYSLGVLDKTKKQSFAYNSEEEFINIIKTAEEGGEAGKVVENENSFDGDGYSYEIEVPAMSSTKYRACYLVEMPIVEEDVNDLTGFSLAVKGSFEWFVAGVSAFKVSTEDESVFEGSAGLRSGASYDYAENTWSNLSLDLKTSEGDKTAYAYYNGKLYFLVIAMDMTESGTPDTLYIDSVGAGYSNLRYVFMDGTSMATPAITGATAVVYSELEESGKLDGLDAAQKAAYVADTVKAKTVQRDCFKSICTTEGAFDFNVSEADYTPVIDSSKPTAQGTVVIEGNFLGTDSGTVQIGGIDCEIKSWSDTNVVVKIPDGLENGRYSLDFTKSNGKTATKKIIIDTVKSSNEQAFEGKIELPDEIKECNIQLTALNGKLYVFPRTVNESLDNTLIWNTMWSYDKDENSWEKCADIPASEKALSTHDDYYSISVSTYMDYVIAHISYIAEKTMDAAALADEYYIYNPKKDSWTKLDMSAIDNLPTNPIICGSDAGLFLAGGYNGAISNENIYKINFNYKKVESGASSVKATGFTKSGTCKAADLSDASVSSYGDEIFICSSECIWLKWNDSEQKFNVQTQAVTEPVGGDNEPVSFSAEFSGCLTPSGAVITAMNGNAYSGRGYDTFYLSEDGTRASFGKVASFADLYRPSACYSDGIMYVWGDSAYTEESTMGVLVYTKVNMPRIESSKLSGNSVTLNWRPLDYEGNVRVFYKEGNSSWKVAGDTNKTSYTISGLANGTKYTFTLRAVDKSGIDYISSYDKTGTSVVYLDSPVIKKAVSTKSGCATLAWTKNSKATGYQIFYKYGSTSKKITVKSNKTLQKVIKNLKKGKTYKFKVRSYKKVSGVTYYSQWSALKKVKIKK